MLTRAFHPTLHDLAFLRQRKDMFFEWKRQVDRQAIRNEIEMSALPRCELVMRVCGRESMIGLVDSMPTDDDLVEYRLKQTIAAFTEPAMEAAFKPEIGRTARIANVEVVLLMAVEMFNLTFMPHIGAEYEKGENADRQWIVHSVRNLVNQLLTNTYDHALWNSFGGSPLAVAVGFLQCRVGNSEPVSEMIVLCQGKRGHATDALRRLHERRSAACKISTVRLTCLRLPSDMSAPATIPIPETSDGVGSTAIINPEANPRLRFERLSSENSLDSSRPEKSRSAKDEGEHTGMPIHSSS